MIVEVPASVVTEKLIVLVVTVSPYMTVTSIYALTHESCRDTISGWTSRRESFSLDIIIQDIPTLHYI